MTWSPEDEDRKIMLNEAKCSSSSLTAAQIEALRPDAEPTGFVRVRIEARSLHALCDMALASITPSETTDIRNATLEEAARVCEAGMDGTSKPYADACFQCACLIREQKRTA